jgi:hypothetical protein
VYVAGWLHSGRSGIPGMEGHGTVRKYRSGFPDTVTEIPARDQSLVNKVYGRKLYAGKYVKYGHKNRNVPYSTKKNPPSTHDVSVVSRSHKISIRS